MIFRSRNSIESPNSHDLKSFTLVELLVVIAIIGILASLLLPALKKAKEQGLSALCMSNQKQCMVAANMYANDFAEWFPSRDGGTDTATRPQRMWPDCLMFNGYLPSGVIMDSYYYKGNVMSSLVSRNNVFSCPLLPPPETHAASHVYVNHEASTSLSFGLRYFPSSYAGEKYANYAISRQGIQPKLPYMADSSQIDVTQQCGELRMKDYGYNHGVIHRRHNLKANISFPDGHVESLNKNGILGLWPTVSSQPYSYP